MPLIDPKVKKKKKSGNGFCFELYVLTFPFKLPLNSLYHLFWDLTKILPDIIS